MHRSKTQVASQTVVVAKQPLRFGTELNASMLQEVPWPSDSLPAGAFAKIDDIMSGGRRVVLAAIEANEPVLALKITGAGQRATLSALVKPGMKAVTIRVNDVEGVGGFVLPGDHVDVVLTRSSKRDRPRLRSCCRTRACSRLIRPPMIAPPKRRSRNR